jgi:uncharacterized membrane protein YgcG
MDHCGHHNHYMYSCANCRREREHDETQRRNGVTDCVPFTQTYSQPDYSSSSTDTSSSSSSDSSFSGGGGDGGGGGASGSF